MNRRQFLDLWAGVALAGVAGVRPVAAGRRIVVAGGGIIGASIAYRLAHRGAEVTLVEKSAPASGATSKSFAWINATFSKQPRHYYELNRLGIAAHHQLDHELHGELKIRWGGSLEWYADQENARRLQEELRRHQTWAYGTQLIDADRLRSLEKQLVPGPVVAACHSEEEGHVDPVHAVSVLLKHAARAGARIVHPCEIRGLEARDNRVRTVRTSQGDFEADALVIACGVDTRRVAGLAGLAVPLKDSPGVLAHSTPAPPLLERVALAPGAHMKQKPDGSIVTGAGFSGSPTTDASPENGRRHLEAAAQYLPGLRGVELDRVTLGWRPLPKDDHPIIGFPRARPNVYLAVMHSGVTLSALVGRLAATEILDGIDVDLLQPYRLERFS